MQPHPRKVLKDAEDLFQRLKFELTVEGTIRTQQWYVMQIIAFSYAEEIRHTIQRITTTVKDEFVSPADSLIADKKALWASVWLQRGMEACHKAKNQIEALETKYTELKGYNITELQWYPSKADEALAEIEADRVKIIYLFAEIVPELCVMPAGGNLPDILGQVRALLAEELVIMMGRKQEEGFKKLFIGYFNASITIERHFIKFAQQPGKDDYIHVAMDTMLDIMDISGLAFLFSELDGTSYRGIVVSSWDTYFNQAVDKIVTIKALYDAIDSKLTLPIYSSSAMQRISWGQRLANAMVNRGINIDRHYWGHQKAIPHQSAIIESVLISVGYPTNAPHLYFGALYIALREEAKGIPLPRPVENCVRSINRASKSRGV